MPVDDRYARSKFKDQVLSQTDDVELMEFILIGLIVVDIILGLYRHYLARFNAMEQIAAINNAHNTPPIQRRNSMALLQVADR